MISCSRVCTSLSGAPGGTGPESEGSVGSFHPLRSMQRTDGGRPSGVRTFSPGPAETPVHKPHRLGLVSATRQGMCALSGAASLRGCAVLSVLSLVALAAVTWAAGGPGWSRAPVALRGIAVAVGVIASCWHGVAFTELALLAGPERVGTALGLGSTFAFGAYFLTPLLVAAVLRQGSWVVAWGGVAAVALGALLWLPPPKGPPDRAF